MSLLLLSSSSDAIYGLEYLNRFKGGKQEKEKSLKNWRRHTIICTSVCRSHANECK